MYAELILFVGLSHPKTMSEMKKPPCIKNNIKKEQICFIIEFISFNLKDNFATAREPMACCTIFLLLTLMVNIDLMAMPLFHILLKRTGQLN